MRRRIGVITRDKFRTWEMKNLAKAAMRKGADLVVLDPGDCALDVISGRPLDRKGLPLQLDVCLGRVDGGCLDAGVRLLESIEGDFPVLNRAAAFRTGRDKRLMSRALARAQVPHPQTWVIAPRRIPAIASLLPFPLVLKPPRGSEGRGVVLIKGVRPLLDLAKRAEEPLYLQAYLKGIRREVRLLVLDGEAIGAVARRPRAGEWRANLSLGALVERFPVDDACRSLALRAAAAIGADFAGVDLALAADGASVLEVNVCPGFHGFARATGIDVAAYLVDALLHRIEKEGVADESVVAHRSEDPIQRS